MKIVRWIAVTKIMTSFGLFVPVSAQDCIPARATATISGEVLRDGRFYPNSGALAISGLPMELVVTEGGQSRPVLPLRDTNEDGAFEFGSLRPNVQYLVRPYFDRDSVAEARNGDRFNWREGIRVRMGPFGHRRVDFTLEPVTHKISI